MNKHYSLDNLNEIASGDKEFLTLVVKTFLEEIPLDLEMFSSAIENNNKKLAYQFAHKMKPNIEIFGIQILKEISLIESWTESSKNNDFVLEQLKCIQAVLNKVFVEMRIEFQ